MSAGHFSRPPAWLVQRGGMEGFTSHHVDVVGATMHVMSRGAGQPVVMLHGNPTWGYLWRKVAARLPEDRFRVVLPDLVGLGYSARVPARAHTLEAHIAWMAELLRREGLVDGAVFVGQDWGGSIGLGALAAAGARPRGIVLANTAVSPPRPGFRPTAFHRFARWPVLSQLAFRGLGFPQVALGLAQGDRRSLWFEPAYLAPLADPRANTAPLALARMVPDGPAHPSVAPMQRIEAWVKALQCPLRLVWGMRDPILGRVVNHLERLLPEAVVTRTSGGHFLPEEEPDAIAEAIRAVASR
jgi:pimeloyl-ACP methyl ester carboxylesterase